MSRAFLRVDLPHFHRAFRYGNLFALSRSRFAHEGRDHRRLLKTGKQFAVLVEKLTAPADVMSQDVVEFRARGDLHDAFVEFVARAESPGIPRRDLAEHPAAEFPAKNFNHQIQMAAHDARAFGESRFGQQLAARQEM